MLDEPIRGDDGEIGIFGELLVDPLSSDAYAQLLNHSEIEQIRALLGSLNERERMVLRARYGIGQEARSLRQVGDQLGLSAERVRQIEERALGKLRVLASSDVSPTNRCRRYPMTIIRWQPAQELDAIQNEMNRLFNNLFDGPGTNGRGSVAAARWVPAMDLIETAGAYILRADLPGLSEQDVNIELQDNVLTISGERPSEQDARGEGYHRLERARGSFARSLMLPDGVNAEAVSAQFDRGVLEVQIPKPEQTKPRRVTINAAERRDTVESTAADSG